MVGEVADFFEAYPGFRGVQRYMTAELKAFTYVKSRAHGFARTKFPVIVRRIRPGTGRHAENWIYSPVKP
ncbi:MAG: hypothetical protein ACRECP_00015 [Methylocella sp.]